MPGIGAGEVVLLFWLHDLLQHGAEASVTLTPFSAVNIVGSLST